MRRSSMIRHWVLLSFLGLIGCGDSNVKTGQSTGAVKTDWTVEDLAKPGVLLPAAAGGESSEIGPGVPADFTGDLNATQPISPAVQAAIDAANALSAARNPASQRPVDRGFAAGRDTKKSNDPAISGEP